MTKDMQILSDLAADLESKQVTALAANTTALQEKQKLVSKRPQKPPTVTNPVNSQKPKLASNTKTQVSAAVKKKPVIKTKLASAPSTPNPKPVPTDQTSKPETSRTLPNESGKNVATKQPTAEAPQIRPWNINLISTPDKVYATRFSNRARAKGISTELQEITVRGIPYWRVQVTGFSTQSVAKAYSDSIKDKLGLKDTWIMRR